MVIENINKFIKYKKVEKLKEIIRKNGMSARPEYYSGRGATTCDLNSDMLFCIHKDIIDTFGEKAGKGFVDMVNGIKVISATAFLNGLYELFHNAWEYNDLQPQTISIQKDQDGNYDHNIGMVGIMETLFSSGRDDTNTIKSIFLASNGIKQTYRYIDGHFYF